MSDVTVVGAGSLSASARELAELRELRAARHVVASAGRRAKLRRRVLVLSIAMLAVLASTMTVSSLANTGTLTAAVTGSAPSFVYTVAANTTLPAAVTSLEYTPAADITSAHVINTAVLPSWSPSAQSAGSVTTAGDIALIDGTVASNGVAVSLYITNLAGLQQDYSSFALPLDIYSSPCTAGAACVWTQASTIITAPPTYLTSTTGFVEFNLPHGSYYDIALDVGGSYFCTSTSTSGTAALAPAFYVTAQPY